MVFIYCNYKLICDNTAVKKKLTVVVGLGKTGLSCMRYLKKKGINAINIDTQDANACDHLNQADEIIVSPGVSIKQPIIKAQKKRNIPIIGDVELFAREAEAPIVAITGSNGKTTVTTLVGKMAQDAGLDARIGGNIGTPVLDLLEDTEPDLYVLELSSFQLETTYSLKAAAAVVLNISTVHMNRYDNIEEYTAAKMRIYENCKIAVYPTPGPSPLLTQWRWEKKIGEFSVINNHLSYNTQKLIPISSLRIKGKHQIENALAALALGTAVNLPMKSMLKTLKEFTGLSHRCQWVANINNVDWYNDSKATNVGATVAAINGLGDTGKIVLIAGGQGKNADFTPLINPIKKYVRSVILIGEDAAKIEATLKGASKILHADSMRKAVKIAHKESQPGDIVLLSPACASFDMFDNFEDRGDVFCLTLPRPLVCLKFANN